jgi:hypothetical protein
LAVIERKIMPLFKHELGIKAKSRISGFKGVIVARSEHLFGCNRYWLAPAIKKDGTVPDGLWFDEDEVERIANTKKISVPKKNTGGFPSKIK